ncbi:ThiF family adenylyltransferase [Streptomyces mexicanus]|uniref:ThiF family adenylyltransferase n=1 Tax=Streptomyces mexicanus TaxID=178566 RepID=A0A7X1I3Q8_9ACTN|nr:ThiF family adenylyltransferase [Streptomyces mexicanus]MBC2867123.1 ThiF family adenylyltransferase [Streptomyces mexicanus]
MTEPPEDRVWARHPRRTGAVLIVGAGAVGGFVAEELARIGFSPLHLVDPDTLAVENIVRHPLGAPELGRPKASALAGRIRRDFPSCAAVGHCADFLELSAQEQRALVREADVVVAATDSAACQREVNEVALVVGRPAVYPAVWVDPRIRDAEVGEILWVLPGRRTPCYACAAAFRRAASDTQAARGARVDIQLIALATAQVVTALAHPGDARAGILDPRRTAIYLHGFTPTSPGVESIFPTDGLSSRSVRVPFPPRPCPSCRGWRYVASSDASATREAGVPSSRAAPEPRWPVGAVLAAVLLLVTVLFVISLAQGTHS